MNNLKRNQFLFVLQKPIIGIVLIGVGVTLLDFSADSCDSPLRALLLDVCNPRDQETGLNIHAFLGGVGASLGYILTAIDWGNINIPSNLIIILN